MPTKSKAQFRLMKAAETNPAVRKRTGLSKRQAAEMTEGQSGKAYKRLPARKRKRKK